MDHVNILRLLGYVDEHKTFPSLITEWMENGNARQYLRLNSHARIKLRLVSRILFVDPVVYFAVTDDFCPLKTRDVVEGLVYLHSKEIIHGDLKAVRHKVVVA